MADRGSAWIRFLRLYGPGSSNDNQYDEKIRLSGKRNGFRPLEFEHPAESELRALFDPSNADWRSVVLTGTAGDGKSHLCGRVWKLLGGSEADWESEDRYLRLPVSRAGEQVMVHVIRDLTGLPEVDDRGRYPSKQQLLEELSNSLFDGAGHDVFLIAANDGQLIESWRRLSSRGQVRAAHRAFETLLVEDRRTVEGVRLHFFNLSRVPSTSLFDLSLKALLDHEGWRECYVDDGRPVEFFGSNCPIRRNFELLAAAQFQSRLRALFELCDHNDFHIPIRRVIQLLVNTVLGHPDSKDGLMRAADVKDIVRKGTIAKASLYNNVFGGNLTEARRESLEVFQCFDRFRIGQETSNRVDNLLIFGDSDEYLREHFDALLGADTFYGADATYREAQRAYVEGSGDDAATTLLAHMHRQRRGLFFKIPQAQEEELGLWDLTVFRFGGEYLSRVVESLRSGKRVERAVVARIVRGLARSAWFNPSFSRAARILIPVPAMALSCQL